MFPRSRPFPNCRALLASSYKGDPTWPVFEVNLTGSSILSISFLTAGQTFWSLIYIPLLGTFVFFSVKASMKWEMCTSSMCLLQRNYKGGVFKIAEATQLRECTSVRTYGVAAHSKDMIYNVIVLKQIQDKSAWSESLEEAAWTTPSRMSSESPKSGDVTLVAILSTVISYVKIILHFIHSPSI